jgi:hypothetical protein
MNVAPMRRFSTMHYRHPPPWHIAVFAGLIGPALVIPSASAQSSAERFNRQMEQMSRETLMLANPEVPAEQRALIDYGAYLSLDYLTVDDNVQNNHVLRQTEAVGYLRMNFDGAHELFLRGSVGWQDFNEGDSFDGRGDERIDPQFDRAYYRYDLARARAAYQGQPTRGNMVVTGGRDLVDWANGLVLNQVLDGARIDTTFGQGWGVTGIGGVTIKDTIDFDSSRPGYDVDTHRGFFGGMLSRSFSGHRPYIYGLVQRDYNDADQLLVPVFGSGTIATDFEYNSHYIGGGVAGPLGNRLLYSAEVVYEGGESLSNSFTLINGIATPIQQTTEDISAWAADVRLDYLLPDARNTHLSTELIAASGDDDRYNTSTTFGGNASGTDDNAFNALGLLNTGLAFAPAVSNLLALRVGASTFPMPDYGPIRRLQAGTDLFLYAKVDGDAPIDEQATGDDKFLGWEPDFYANWAITSDVTLALRYGVFFPSDAFLIDDARQFVFIGVTYGF